MPLITLRVGVLGDQPVVARGVEPERGEADRGQGEGDAVGERARALAAVAQVGATSLVGNGTNAMHISRTGSAP